MKCGIDLLTQNNCRVLDLIAIKVVFRRYTVTGQLRLLSQSVRPEMNVPH